MTTPDDDLLYDLLDRWEEAHDRGAPLDPAELCRERPDLVAELARRIRNLLRVKRLEPGAAVDLPPADLLHGRYRIRSRIGGGTEGDVWLAYDTLLHRDVAVKLPRGDSDDLLDEARLIASLQHPNILKVLDVGHDARGTVFVVTELMPGRTLAERLRAPDGRRVSVSRVIAWTRQIAAGLHAVHLAGRAHRDVKPVNILFDDHDNAVLADFGIAIDVASQELGGSTGTPAYKSPEQLAGCPLDARSDVYSLALVAHEMLAGGLPFTNLDDPAAIEREIASGLDMRVSKQIPGRLRPVVTQGLALLPERRHESAPQFARDLEQAWRRSTLSRWLGLAVLVAVAGLAILGWRAREDRRRSDAVITRQTDAAIQAAREGSRIRDEAERKVQGLLDLNRRLIDGAMNDPFHRERRAENEARRGAAGETGLPGEAAP
jgi:serine/threonine-protein kinase